MTSKYDQESSHPDSMTRLVSSVHRFKCPSIGSNKLSYARSFKTVMKIYPQSANLMLKADSARISLSEALAGSISFESVVNAARAYGPLVHQIITTCKNQQEMARLDERLVFQWGSGLGCPSQKGAASSSKNGFFTSSFSAVLSSETLFKSEALMYELVMTLACEALAMAGMACEASAAGKFAAAGKYFKGAAGLFDFLARDQIPKWLSQSSNEKNKDLPAECTVGTCEGLKTLCLASAQQMAVATVLSKPDAPNYSLLAKLCLGIADHMHQKKEAFKAREDISIACIDNNMLDLAEFQIVLQGSLSSFFLAKSCWNKDEYGLAIAMLKDAITSTKSLLPEETEANSPRASFGDDVITMRTHMDSLLTSWTNDNSTIYFEAVPRIVPEKCKLSKGTFIMKPDEFNWKDAAPIPLTPRSDSDLARELQAKSLYPADDPRVREMEKSDEELAKIMQAKLDAGEEI